MNAETISQIEIEPPIDRATAYFILGVTSKLIRRVKENTDPRDLTDLKVYLSALTVPPGTTVESYFSDLGMDEYLQTIRKKRTPAGFSLKDFPMDSEIKKKLFGTTTKIHY